MEKKKTKRPKKLNVSDRRLQTTASKLLEDTLVTDEIYYLRKKLGDTATENEIESEVRAVRELSWSTLMGQG